ncbi:MAG: NAD-dependent DNA ligase LigA [Opitutae bacterium]|nr:NAD-dependent DNA ligase LigA [Opitutae bacterium]
MKIPFARFVPVVACALCLSLTAFVQGSQSNDAARLEQLRAEIARHDELYFKKAAPIITDAEYDTLKRELRELEQRIQPATSDDGENAPEGVGDDRSGAFAAARHVVPVLGLEKSHSDTDLRKFLTKIARTLGDEEVVYIVEPKYDGLSISVTYEQGRLVRAVTRGNGREGDDVTGNLLECADVPRQLAALHGEAPALVELRGEAFMSQAEFERLNAGRRAAGDEPFAHPRNVAVGTLKSADATERAGRKLQVVFYGWGAWLPAAGAPASQRDLLARLSKWGLPRPEWARAAVGFDGAWREVKVIELARPTLGFPIDGAVVKVDSAAQRERLGDSSSTPNWAVAHKFEPERVETKLRAITLQIGRTGVLAPVAEVEPVKLGGATIRRVSLHNRDEIARRDLRVGDWVTVEKAGEIIPVITAVNLSRRPAGTAPFIFPADCPSCRAALAAEAGQAAVRCPNRNCPAQVRRRLEHFASAECANLRGFGPGVMEKLVANDLVREPADFFRLERPALEKVVGERTAAKLLAAVAAAKRRDAWRLVLGSGIAEIGPAGAKAIVGQFPSVTTLARATRGDVLDGARSRIPGLSDVAAQGLVAFLENEQCRGSLARLGESLSVD